VKEGHRSPLFYITYKTLPPSLQVRSTSAPDALQQAFNCLLNTYPPFVIRISHIWQLQQGQISLAELLNNGTKHYFSGRCRIHSQVSGNLVQGESSSVKHIPPYSPQASPRFYASNLKLSQYKKSLLKVSLYISVELRRIELPTFPISSGRSPNDYIKFPVELSGIEPLTFPISSGRSPNDYIKFPWS